MLASVALGRSEAAFVEAPAGSVVVDCEVESGADYVEDSKARVLVVISLKTYMQITLAPTNNRLVGYGWMVFPVLPLGLPLNSAAVGMEVGSMQNPANR